MMLKMAVQGHTYEGEIGNFPSDYRALLENLHAAHPNWVFVAEYTGIDFATAVKMEASGDRSQVPNLSSDLIKSNTSSDYYPSSGTYRIVDGSGSNGWVNANPAIISYFMDPRNFLNENRIYMFEDLSYDPTYQTKDVVAKILAPTKLPEYGFTAKIFVSAGKNHDISPVHLASRARQESGGGSISINGSKGVYNPFNIGAYKSVSQGISYARSRGWTTPKKSVNGGASFISRGYIGNGQNTVYFQRFDVTKGLSKVGTHVYMTNVRAPFFEATSTKSAYKSYGITKEALTFIIPVYKGMPSSTSL
jgi:beta-N-acetylglucosaminidase